MSQTVILKANLERTSVLTAYSSFAPQHHGALGIGLRTRLRPDRYRALPSIRPLSSVLCPLGPRSAAPAAVTVAMYNRRGGQPLPRD